MRFFCIVSFLLGVVRGNPNANLSPPPPRMKGIKQVPLHRRGISPRRETNKTKQKKERKMKKILAVLSLIFSTVSYADTETIKWYVDGSVYNTTTCQSGGNVTLPTQPSKPGYTFLGWIVALHDFSTLDSDVEGTNHTHNASAYTWATTFPYGIVSGIALCSITGGSYPVAGTPDESTGSGQYCWCKATAYTPSSSNIAYENTSSSAWVFLDTYSWVSDCARNCAGYCGNNVRYYAAFRRAMFGVTQ